ncbi:Cystathionine beta-lyase [Rhodotorula toruloides]|nr:Cystathionine beta-lyase [Rhodotorula toruloides]
MASSTGYTTPASPSSSEAAHSLTSSLLRARPYRFATQVATVDNPDPSHKDQYGASSVPIYQTATFKGMGGAYDYTRSGNPTRSHLEHHIAKISNARHAFAVTSGMGALDVIFRLLKPGDEIIAGNDLYGGSNRLIGYLKAHGGITTHHVDTTNPKSLLPYLEDPSHNVAMVLLESPTNPLLQIADLEEIARLTKRYRKDAIIVVDNTMMSPYLCRPLELGCDVVYDSGTKYLSGHHDLMAGLICCDRDDVAKGIAFTINSIGNGLSPFDSFLLLRGVKTLSLRIDKQQANSILIAEYLANLGFKVNYPGLKGHKGKEVHDRIAKGPGAVLSFETGDVALSERVVGSTRLWGISVSFGCINSLISMPCLMSHASIDPAVRAARNLPEDLIRLCVGIEDPADLIDDLEAALLEAGAVRVVDEGMGGRARLERIVKDGEGRVVELANGTLQGDSANGATQAKVEKIITSAPGKVILFGEHAVVHGVTAIAGAIDLRCYCLAESRSDGQLSLVLPDLGYSQTWDIASLPWDKVDALSSTVLKSGPKSDAVPDQELLTLLANKFVHQDKLKAVQAAQAFLYLYLHLAVSSGIKPAQTYTVRSGLPISAGLGSSAAYSVAVASSLLYSHGILPAPASSPSADSTIPIEHANMVNSWAFLAEKVIHGTPSGVDNTVATLGGAIAFRRAVKGREGSMDVLKGFDKVEFLLTDTKVPRDTKTLVAGVARRKLEEPDTINPLLTSIQRISDEAQACLSSTTLSRSEQLDTLSRLVEQNHQHLVSLGVGHVALEAVRSKTKEQPWGLATKLTGAGGGGCAVTVVPDSFPEDKLTALRAALANSGFETYATSVGGRGFGVLIPTHGSQLETAEGGVELSAIPQQKRFEEAQTEELGRWAEEAGVWLFLSTSITPSAPLRPSRVDMSSLEDTQPANGSGGEDLMAGPRATVPRPPSRRSVASSDGTSAHPLLAPSADDGAASPSSGSYAVYSPGKKRAAVSGSSGFSSSSVTPSPLSPNEGPLSPSSASSATHTPPFVPTTAPFLPPLVSRPSNSTLPSPSGRQYARSVSEAKEKLQKQALKAELQGLGLSAESAGSALVNKLATLGEDADFKGLQAVLAGGKTTLLLPAEKLESPAQLTPSFVLDHLVLLDPPASGSSAAIERPFVTLSGLRGVLVGGELVFTSCAAESQRQDLADYASEDLQRQLRGVAPLTAPPTTASYPSTMLISAFTTLSIPQSRSATPPSATSSRTTSRLAALFSKPPVAETGTFDLPPVVPAPAGLLGDSSAQTNDVAASGSSSSVDVAVLAVGKVVRRQEVLASLRSATSAHMKLLVRGVEGAQGEADVGVTVSSFAERFCPSPASPEASTSGKATTPSVPTSGTNLLDADPLAVADTYQETMHAVRLDLTRNIGSAPSAPSEIDSSTAPSLEDFSQLEERVDASLEKVEEVVTSVLYDRLFAPPTARDLQEDENLASRIAALNVLELDLEHLGLELGDEEGLAGWEGRSSNARDSLEDLAALVGKELNRLEDPEERTPNAKLAILVECHKILVDGLSKLPPIPLKKEVTGDDKSSLSDAPAEVEMDDASSRSSSLPPSRPMSPPSASGSSSAEDADDELLKTPKPPPAADHDVPEIKLPDPSKASNEATSSSLFDPVPAPSPPVSIFETKRRPASVSSSSATSSADLILPILIYSVVRANPPHLVSHLRFIHRFRSESLFRGQASYCATNFDAVVEWSQHVDLSTLGLSSAKVFAAAPSPSLSSSPSQSRPRAQTTPSSILRARVSTTADQLVDSANSALSGVVDSSYRILFGPKGLTSSAPKSLDDVKSVLDGARGKARGTLPFRRSSSARDFPTLLVGRRRGGSVASGKAVTIAGDGDEKGLASTSEEEVGVEKSEEMVDIVASSPSGTPAPRISTEESYAPPPPPLPPRCSSFASTTASKEKDDSDTRSVRSVSSFLNFRESTLGRALGEVRDGVVGAAVGAASGDERGGSSPQPSLGGRLLNRFSGGGPATSSSASQGSTTSPSSSRRSTLLNPLGGVHLSPWGAAVPSTSTATHSSTPLSPVPASPLNSVILSAPAYQPVQRFLDVKDAGELRIGEVQELLEEYRRLVKHLQETASREGMEAKEEGEGKPTEEKAVQADSSVAPSGGEEA